MEWRCGTLSTWVQAFAMAAPSTAPTMAAATAAAISEGLNPRHPVPAHIVHVYVRSIQEQEIIHG